MEEYIKNYTSKARFTSEIFNRDLYVPLEKLNYYLHERYSSIPLLERIDEISLKIAEIEFRGNKSRAKQIRKWLKERLNISIDMKEIYKGFFRSNEFKKVYDKELPDSYINKLDSKDISYEDACLFVYMKSLLTFLGYDYMIEQTIIDEAQDYNVLQYILLKKILRKSIISKDIINATVFLFIPSPYQLYQKK